MTSLAAHLHLVAAPEAANDSPNVTPDTASAVSPNHNSQSTTRELAQAFLDTATDIMRKKYTDGSDCLDMFRDRHSARIRADQEQFFTELIRLIQQRVSFVSGTPVGNGTIVAFGTAVSGLWLRFVSQACRNSLIAVLPSDMDIPDEQTTIELEELPDDELRAHIISFDRFDSPWLFFTALYVIGKRKLPARYTPR
jgi:hypothetical protein